MIVDQRLCLGCAVCAAVCPNDAVTISGGKPEFSSDCNDCGLCARVCPTGALREGEER